MINDDDMKWHVWMTNDNLVYAVLATLAAAAQTPPHPKTRGCDWGQLKQHFTHQNQFWHTWNFTKNHLYRSYMKLQVQNQNT